jgi:hypothetical protein
MGAATPPTLWARLRDALLARNGGRRHDGGMVSTHATTRAVLVCLLLSGGQVNLIIQ